MARALVIFTELIHDPDTMSSYARRALPELRKYGGTVLAADTDPQVLEGVWHGTQTVILAFPDLAAARAWYSSDGYSAAALLRQAAAESNVAIVRELDQ